MKKITYYAILTVIVLVFIAPMSVDARRGGVYGGTTWRGPHYSHYGYPSRTWGAHYSYHGYPSRAWRAHSGWSYRFYWGGPGVVWPWYPSPYYYSPYYYYTAPPAVIQQPPPVYQSPQEPPPAPQYWYYCQDPQGYYPYVKNCPGGWMKVVPNATPPNK